MKILYGVVGEGMGHATRSRVVIEGLLNQGHQVKIVVSGRAFNFLSKHFEDVVEIRGLTAVYRDGGMDVDASILKNVVLAPSLLLNNTAAYFDKVRDFGPAVAISDFDYFAYLFGRLHKVPVLSIDNQQIIHRCKHEKEIRDKADFDFRTTRAFVKAKLPGCKHYIITSFFAPPVRKKYAHNTTIVPPILRREVLELSPTRSSHVLVYQTSVSDRSLIPTLNRLTEHQFIVYGLRRNAVEGNCTIKDFDEKGFINDLASSRAVVSNGGLSLLHEAIYLQKPVFSVPLRNQFEQEMNARYLEKLGYGLASPKFDADTLLWFLRQEKQYLTALKNHRQDGNSALFRTINEQLETLTNGQNHMPN